MDGEYTSIFTEKERAALRAQRIAARKKKLRARRRRRFIQLFPFFLLTAVVGICLFSWLTHEEEALPEEILPEEPVIAEPVSAISEGPELPYAAATTPQTVSLTDPFTSSYGILVDLSSDTVLAEKLSDTRISPASMTKVLTLLVAVEQIEDLSDTYTMNIEITDYCFVNDCSVVGYNIDDTATLHELLYGIILPSGADASLAVANYVAGSHEAFVALMNQKLEELGLADTAHFTNCVGLYDEDHYCTVYDMAMILRAAMENELCRDVLNARTHETAPMTDYPDGQVMSNWFLRRIEDRDTGDVDVIAGKTGYVVEAGSCAVSGGRDADGNEYIAVTADAQGSWKAIEDHVYLYKTYCN